METVLGVGDWVRITEELELDGVGVTVPVGIVGTVQEFVDGAAWVLCPTLRDQLPATNGCVVAYDHSVLERIDLAQIIVHSMVGQEPGYVCTCTSTLVEWATANEDLDDLDDAVAKLISGETVVGGGGAAPRYEVIRLK